MSSSTKSGDVLPAFGNQLPFCEPYWYQGLPTQYYTANHVAFRNKVREFVDEELRPNIDKWVKDPKGYPLSLHKRAYELGIQGVIYDKEFGGTKPDDFDAFYELILWDEFARMGGGGVLGQMSINSMALPPILMFGTEKMKREVCRPVIQGDKNICLAISEPWVGSDVANLRTSARKTKNASGQPVYVVNGLKKWITGGLFADYFTTAVRTGGDGVGGISLLLIPRHTKGVSIRKMETQFDNSHNTTFVTLEDVEVPCENLIGKENQGFMLIMHNFNHERFVISAGAARMARCCYEEAFQFALDRKTFGKPLVSHQVIRAKLAEMARRIESLHDQLERTAWALNAAADGRRMGGRCALLKVSASTTFEYCAREASQIFGGSSIVKEGKGPENLTESYNSKRVERMYREVRATAIPGGSEEILLDLAIRQAVSYAQRAKSKL